MKFLEAKAAQLAENKMKPGTRPDQQAVRKVANTAVPPRPEVVALARSLEVDLSVIVGSGRNGEILEKDVRAASK